MSTVAEVRNIYHTELSRFVNKDIADLIISYIRIVAQNECEWCCIENCRKLKIDHLYWIPFNRLCKLLLCDGTGKNGLLTFDFFVKNYIGEYDDFGECAKVICESYHRLDNLPWYIISNVNWNSVWDDISVDFWVSDNYVFHAV